MDWIQIDWKSLFRETIKNTVEIELIKWNGNFNQLIVVKSFRRTVFLSLRQTYFITFLNLTRDPTEESLIFFKSPKPHRFPTVPIPRRVIHTGEGALICPGDFSEKSFCLRLGNNVHDWIDFELNPE